MTTLAVGSRKSRRPDINRPAGALFAKVFAEGYLEASDAVKEVIESMSRIVNDPAADEDERSAALDTLVDALFPPRHPDDLGVDLETLEEGDSNEARRIRAAMSRQEVRFARAVRKLMKERGVSQKKLAEKIGVGQPAVSMMLSRRCRPQQATVEKIAKALGVEARTLWT